MVRAELLERELDGEEITGVHVVPPFGAAHAYNADCWCHPEILYCKCGCGQELMVFHNVAH